MTKLQEQEQEERAESRARLLETLSPGDTVYTILRHVSRSGMSRVISFVKPGPTNKADEFGIFDLTWNVGKVLGYRYDDRGGLVVGGCGMDMGFHVVYSLGRTLWPDGYQCVGDRYRCQSNVHVNPGPLRDDYSGTVEHKDGGYAFSHRWL